MDKCKKNKCCSSPFCNCKEKPIRCVITGGTGQLSYSLIYMVARGEVFGKERPVVIKLHDEASKITQLEGLKLELEDCLFPLLNQVVVSSDLDTVFFNVTIAFLVGGKPRTEGMERKDLITENIKFFKAIGESLNRVADRDVKVLVIANPVNTNTLICSQFAPAISTNNFTAMTRLDQNRATAQISRKIRIPFEHIKNVIIWGNHSDSVYTDATNAVYILGANLKSVSETINDAKYVNKTLVETIQNRGTTILAARKKSSAMSAAKAACDHMKDWIFGVEPGRYVSMGVLSDGSYEVPEGIVFSFPVEIVNGDWEIVQGLPLCEEVKLKMQENVEELLAEKEEALEIVNKKD